MRITFLNQFYPPDIAPTARLAGELAEHLASRGNSVSVIAGADGYVGRIDAHPSRPGGGVQLFRVRTPQRKFQGIASRLVAYLCYFVGAAWKLSRMPKQQVIVALTTPPLIVVVAILVKWLKGSRVVLWSMDLYPEALEAAGMIRSTGCLGRLLRKITRFMYANVDEIICLDDAMAELLNSRYASPAINLPITVISNWESASRFPQSGAPLDDELLNVFADPKRFVILYLGNAGVGHEFETILKVAKQLCDDGITFLFVGGGRQRQKLERAKREHDLRNVVFSDYVPTAMLPTLLGSVDMSLITLRVEARGVMSPSKLYTYLAAALPVLYVGPTRTNVDDAIVRFRCGLSFRNAETAEVVQALRSLRADENKLQHLRHRALFAYEDAYCASKTLPKFHELFSGLENQQRYPRDSRAA